MLISKPHEFTSDDDFKVLFVPEMSMDCLSKTNRRGDQNVSSAKYQTG